MLFDSGNFSKTKTSSNSWISKIFKLQKLEAMAS